MWARKTRRKAEIFRSFMLSLKTIFLCILCIFQSWWDESSFAETPDAKARSSEKVGKISPFSEQLWATAGGDGREDVKILKFIVVKI